MSAQMSARAAVTGRASTGTRTRTRPQTSTRPKLKVLNQEAIRQRSRRRNALVVLFIVVLLGFFAVAFVHAQLVAGQQDLDSVRSRIAEAEAHRAKIARLVEEASSPAVIVPTAMDELGMVRAHQPVYLQAVSPVRELPTVATFVPRGAPEHLDVAAGVSSSAPGISPGVSAEIEVVAEAEPNEAEAAAIGAVEAQTVQVETPTPAPAVTATPAVTAVQTPTPTEVVVSTGGAFGGVVVATSNSTQAARSDSGFSGASTSSQQTGSSFAGSTAVSGGQGSG